MKQMNSRSIWTSLYTVSSVLAPYVMLGAMLSILSNLMIFNQMKEHWFNTKIYDWKWMHYISKHGFGFSPLFFMSTILGTIPVVIAATGGMMMYLYKKNRLNAAWTVFIFAFGGFLVCNGLKMYFGRERPWGAAGAGEHTYSYSFPSGHCVISFSVWSCFAWFATQYFSKAVARAVIIAIAAVIWTTGIGRVYYRTHYPTDIIGGNMVTLLWLAPLMYGVYKHYDKLYRTEDTRYHSRSLSTSEA
jgi:membrane-associated phospholipid phosphatase